MLKIDPSKQAVKFLNTLPSKQAKQIAKKLMALREQPSAPDVKKLTHSTYSRADIGEYRIIFFVEKYTLFVPLIGKRNDGDIYKKMKRLPR